jgi:U3 small nucleolar RNA-associated protein 14
MHSLLLLICWNIEGWGSWAGAGLEKKVEKQLKKKYQRLLEKRKRAEDDLRAQRQDKQLPHVILNHKRDRKVEKKHYSLLFSSSRF